MTNKFLHVLYDITDEATSGDIQKLAEFIGSSNIAQPSRSAKIPSVEEMDELNPEQCAVSLFVSGTGSIRKFAHYRKDLAELNIAMLSKNHKNIPDEICKVAAYNLNKAAERFDLDFPEDLDDYVSGQRVNSLLNIRDIDELAYMRKLAKYRDIDRKEESYALNHGRKRYPLHDESYIKTACGYFEKYKHEFKALDKLAYCKNTSAAGERESVEIEGTLVKFAELDTSKFSRNFPLHLTARKRELAGNEDALTIYDELLEKSAELGPEKTAEALEVIDRKFKLNRHWGSRVEEPLLTVMGPLEKIASIDFEGTTITRDSFKSLQGTDLSGIVDSYTQGELYGDTNESLDVFSSLPTPIKRSLVEKMNG